MLTCTTHTNYLLAKGIDKDRWTKILALKYIILLHSKTSLTQDVLNRVSTNTPVYILNDVWEKHSIWKSILLVERLALSGSLIKPLF